MNARDRAIPADEPPHPRRPAFGGWDNYRDWAQHDFTDRARFEENEQGDGPSRAEDSVAERTSPRRFTIVLNEPDATGQRRLACRTLRSAGTPRVCEPVPADAIAPVADMDLSFVRPYMHTVGERRQRNLKGAKITGSSEIQLQVETIVSAVQLDDAAAGALSDRQRGVRGVCALPLSVAEIAAELSVTIGQATDLVAEGVTLGLLIVHSGPELAGNARPTLELLRRVREGLQKMSA